MRVRKYREEDGAEKRNLHLKTIRKVNSRDYSKEQIDAWTTFDQEKTTEEGNTERWVAVEDGDIIGFGDYIPEEAEITGIYVHPDYLRQGIGSKLLEKIEEDARSREIEKLSLISTVTARDFYEAEGYKVMEQLMYETSGEELETLRMEKELD